MSNSGGGQSTVARKRTDRSDSDSKAENRCYFKDLGDDLLAEILIRLPSETIVRCKAVCRKWCTVIGEGDFLIRRYIQHRSELKVSLKLVSLVYQFTYKFRNSNSQWTVKETVIHVNIATENRLIHNLYKDGVADMRFLPCVQQPFPSILPNGQLDFTLEASCADLLLCCYNNPSTSMSVYYICNLTTKQWIALPPIQRCSADVGLLFDPMPCLDSELEFYNFKIVRIPIPRRFQGIAYSHSELEIQIFCSKEGRWRNNVVSLSRIVEEPPVKNHMIAYNRMLHKLALNVVIVFDPFCANPVSRIIDLPPGVSIRPWDYCYLSNSCFGVSGGQLCLSEISKSEEGPILQVWELVDYKNVKWCVALRISNIRLLFPFLEVKTNLEFAVIAFHPYKRDTLYLRVGKYIVKCNMRQVNKFKVLYEFIRPCEWVGMEVMSWVNTFPLVHHWWPTPVLSVPEVRDNPSEEKANTNYL